MATESLQDKPADEVERLIVDAHGGCRESLGRLLQGCQAYLLHVANADGVRHLQGKESPSDLVQLTFLHAARDFGQFHGQGEQELRAWLASLLRNVVLNRAAHYRRAKRLVQREVPLEGRHISNIPSGAAAKAPSPSEQAMAREQDSALQQALARLPEHYRQVIQWRYRDKLSFADIKDRLKCSSEQAAQKLWHRALKKLKKELGELHEPS